MTRFNHLGAPNTDEPLPAIETAKAKIAKAPTSADLGLTVALTVRISKANLVGMKQTLIEHRLLRDEKMTQEMFINDLITDFLRKREQNKLNAPKTGTGG